MYFNFSIYFSVKLEKALKAAKAASAGSTLDEVANILLSESERVLGARKAKKKQLDGSDDSSPVSNKRIATEENIGSKEGDVNGSSGNQVEMINCYVNSTNTFKHFMLLFPFTN